MNDNLENWPSIITQKLRFHSPKLTNQFMKVLPNEKNNILKALVKFWGYSIIIQEK